MSKLKRSGVYIWKIKGFRLWLSVKYRIRHWLCINNNTILTYCLGCARIFLSTSRTYDEFWICTSGISTINILLRYLRILIICVLLFNNSIIPVQFTDYSKCRIHYSRSEGTYKTFYEFAEIPGESNLTLDFHFSVLSRSDAHILLSPSSNVEKTDSVYEIVIGAGGNTFSDIRRRQKSSVQASYRFKGLLSGLDLSSFWIHIDKGE